MPPPYSIKHQQLLLELKNTVESLLVSGCANVWSIYGALGRLHAALQKIFENDLRNEEEGSFLHFIQGLDWLQPDHTKTYFETDFEPTSTVPEHFKEPPCVLWLYKSLESHSLSQKLSWLLSDEGHLAACYNSKAFLRHHQYSEATLICLRAVEQNQPSLLAEIDPCLFVVKSPGTVKVHRRCSSYPDNHLLKVPGFRKIRQDCSGIRSCNEPLKTTIGTNVGTVKSWSSLPNLQDFDARPIGKAKFSKTTPTTPVYQKKVSPSMFQVDYNVLQAKYRKTCMKTNKKGKKPKHVLINNQDIVEHTVLSSSHSSTEHQTEPNLQRSLVEYNFLPQAGQKDYKNKPTKSFIEDGGMSVLPMATNYFPKPEKGQTLLSFLTSSQFTRANGELDRQNAHFKISEAIISAMEQIKCNRDLKLVDEQLDDSDPEIVDLKQRIRLRRRQKLVEKHKAQFVPGSMLSDSTYKTDTTTSTSPKSTTPESLSDYQSSDEVEDYEITDQSTNLTDQNGLSMSMASLYSEADLMKRPRGAPDGASDVLSAEGVALSLISKFSEKQLPRASELVWLVSEEDAPQALLPMPKQLPIDEDSLVPLRGTKEWAPPRPQLIFTIHPIPNRKLLMEKQCFRCAGCSMKVTPQYASKFRYCDYLGRYFCTGCHTNQLSLIPARILHKWDFARYPVSNFSYRLVEQMYTDPLFRVVELNKNICRLSQNFQFCRKYRLGLFYLKDFVFSCKHAETVQEALSQDVRNYVINDPEIYSLEDLVNVRNGSLKSQLKYLVGLCCRHTSECGLCLARGFVCELCKSEDVIFPWQMRTVHRCEKCAQCYHIKCHQEHQSCPKCCRISQRSKDNAH